MLEDYTPRYPDLLKRRPLMVHAPSNKCKKGTEALQEVLGQLRGSYDCDFKLMHEMARPEALAMIAQSDIFLDQFTIGAEGLASHEAMALGKPVVCFIKNSLQARYPPSLPIVMADQPGLGAAITGLLKDGRRRRELGMRGREYMETFHDAHKVAHELVDIYQDLASRAPGDPESNTLSGCRHWRCLPRESIGPLDSQQAEPCVP
jgi:glycosyltransferase involved in cell wall biosynthesis